MTLVETNYFFRLALCSQGSDIADTSSRNTVSTPPYMLSSTLSQSFFILSFLSYKYLTDLSV